MAEAAGLVASVIQIVDLGLSTAAKLHKLQRDVGTHAKRIERLKRHVESTRRILQHLSNGISSDNAKCITPNDALKGDVELAVDNCRNIFQDIDDAYDDGTRESKVPDFIRKAKYSLFEEKAIDKLCSELHRSLVGVQFIVNIQYQNENGEMYRQVMHSLEINGSDLVHAKVPIIAQVVSENASPALLGVDEADSIKAVRVLPEPSETRCVIFKDEGKIVREGSEAYRRLIDEPRIREAPRRISCAGSFEADLSMSRPQRELQWVEECAKIERRFWAPSKEDTSMSGYESDHSAKSMKVDASVAEDNNRSSQAKEYHSELLDTDPSTGANETSPDDADVEEENEGSSVVVSQSEDHVSQPRDQVSKPGYKVASSTDYGSYSGWKYKPFLHQQPPNAQNTTQLADQTSPQYDHKFPSSADQTRGKALGLPETTQETPSSRLRAWAAYRSFAGSGQKWLFKEVPMNLTQFETNYDYQTRALSNMTSINRLALEQVQRHLSTNNELLVHLVLSRQHVIFFGGFTRLGRRQLGSDVRFMFVTRAMKPSELSQDHERSQSSTTQAFNVMQPPAMRAIELQKEAIQSRLDDPKKADQHERDSQEFFKINRSLIQWRCQINRYDEHVKTEIRIGKEYSSLCDRLADPRYHGSTVTAKFILRHQMNKLARLEARVKVLYDVGVAMRDKLYAPRRRASFDVDNDFQLPQSTAKPQIRLLSAARAIIKALTERWQTPLR